MEYWATFPVGQSTRISPKGLLVKTVDLETWSNVCFVGVWTILQRLQQSQSKDLLFLLLLNIIF